MISGRACSAARNVFASPEVLVVLRRLHGKPCASRGLLVGLAGLALTTSLHVSAHREPGEQALVGLQISHLSCFGESEEFQVRRPAFQPE